MEEQKPTQIEEGNKANVSKVEEQKPTQIEESNKANVGAGGSKVSELKNLYEQKMAASR